jgi:hypothetical protein
LLPVAAHSIAASYWWPRGRNWTTPARASDPLVDVKATAAYLGVNASFVCEHAEELGARRLGSGPKARLCFSLAEVDERLNVCSSGRRSSEADLASQAVSRPRRRRSLGGDVPLPPIRGVEGAKS